MALVSYALGTLVLWWHMWPGASTSILMPALPTRPGRVVLDDRQTSQAGLAVPAAASAGHAEQCTGILLLVGDGTTAAHTPRTRLGAAATRSFVPALSSSLLFSSLLPTHGSLGACWRCLGSWVWEGWVLLMKTTGQRALAASAFPETTRLGIF